LQRKQPQWRKHEERNCEKGKRFMIAEIERLLPDFARSCRDSADVVIIHQDSFAADYRMKNMRCSVKL
jgi:hypothetical protein